MPHAHEAASARIGTSRSVGLSRPISLLDTSVVSDNIGDFIIIEAVRNELAILFPKTRIYTLASQERMTRLSRKLLQRSEFTIAGGTNLLSSRMWFRCPWKLSPLDGLLCRRVVLMGTGWYQFQGSPDPYSRWLIRSVLSRQHLHAVRDSYTKEKLASIGITNVVNTGCPTLWQLSADHCRRIPVEKGDSVLTALNTFMPNPKLDDELLKMLRQFYSNIFFWIQNHADYAYAKDLDPKLNFLSPSLATLDDFLTNEPGLDYVGNRLHGGIRALQHGVRTLVVEIDNRATVMGADFGIPTVKRNNFQQMARWIEGSPPVDIQIPTSAIQQWRSQFSNRVHEP